jgi:membrane associated rhomboid family serine protease
LILNFIPMAYPQTQQKTQTWLSDDNPLLMLIVLNVVMFIILNFINIVYVLSNSPAGLFETQIMKWFTLPASFSSFIVKPWVLVSHMFSQISVWMLIGNMLFLWFFGYIFQDLTGSKHIVPIYIYGALAGAVLFVLSANLLPRFNAVISTFEFTGAGAAVMAVALAATVTAPDYRVFPMIMGGIPLWVITMIYVLINFAGLASSAFPYHLAHLGGAIAGYFYVKQIGKANDPGAWMHKAYHWFMNLFDPTKRKLKPVPKQQIYYNTKGKEPFIKTPNINQKKVDEILDKISAKGYESLNKEEREILKKASEGDN